MSCFIGRRAFTDGLGLENIGLETDRSGRIPHEHWKTSVDGIWALGDVIDGPMLAHKAEEEGVAAKRKNSSKKPVFRSSAGSSLLQLIPVHAVTMKPKVSPKFWLMPKRMKSSARIS